MQAIRYPVTGGAISVDLKATGLLEQVSGHARVAAKSGITSVEVTIQGLTRPNALGVEFLTYVLWAAPLHGKTVNLGRILFSHDGSGKLKATTQLQSFSLFVTVEPYFAVRYPSEMMILENAIPTTGRAVVINGYELVRRDQYERPGDPLASTKDRKDVPLEIYEARNAVAIAKSHKAEEYAPGIFSRSEAALELAETGFARKGNRNDVVSSARQAAQFAEDAREVAIDRQDAERKEAARMVADEQARAAAAAIAAAEASESRRKANEEIRRQSELIAAREARLRAEADARATQMRAQAEIDAARAQAEADVLKARQDATRQAARELRAQLLEQFNRILETRDTPRGLVITVADALIDTAIYAIRPQAREGLARFSGIILSHPGLYLRVEGHTDSTGTAEANQTLSERRAQTVHDFLLRQGLPDDAISSCGFGQTQPIADNDTAAGRQKNRRVEIVVFGQLIDEQLANDAR
jgi:outer membrane protein OmpA-like peptidoglycan-associated protein